MVVGDRADVRVVRDLRPLAHTQVVDPGRELDVGLQIGVQESGQVFVHGRRGAPTVCDRGPEHVIKLI